MTRFTQYRFLGAATLAVVWMGAGVYIGLAQPSLRSTVGLPALWLRGLGFFLGNLIGSQAGALAALILIWAILTALLFGAFELIARWRR